MTTFGTKYQLAVYPLYAICYCGVAVLISRTIFHAPEWAGYFAIPIGLSVAIWHVFYRLELAPNATEKHERLFWIGFNLIAFSLIAPALVALMLRDQGWLILYVGSGPFFLVGLAILNLGSRHILIKKSRSA